MLVDIRIKLLEPFLGDRPTPHPPRIRRFIRREGELLLNMEQWNRAVRQALTDLHMEDVEPASVMFPLTLPLGRTDLFNRKWWDKKWDQGKKVPILREEMCECVRQGAELSFDVVLAVESIDLKNRIITLEEFQRVMEHIGLMIGLSPFGSHFRFGRFKVLSVTPK